MLPKSIPPGNPPPLPGGGPDPACPNFFDSLSMTLLILGLFSYLDIFAGFWLTSWKAAMTSGSYNKREIKIGFEFSPVKGIFTSIKIQPFRYSGYSDILYVRQLELLPCQTSRKWLWQVKSKLPGKERLTWNAANTSGSLKISFKFGVAPPTRTESHNQFSRAETTLWLSIFGRC